MSTRKIFIDTETTGLDPTAGHRIIEVGAIVIENGRVPKTGVFHAYCRPDRKSEPEAFAVHGLSDKFLQNKLPFSATATALQNFLKGADVYAHNMKFDQGFVDAEFKRAGCPSLEAIARSVNCTKLMSYEYNQELERHSLDHLCAHYNIDNSRRKKHNAILDAQLLAQVYYAMRGDTVEIDPDLYKNIHAKDDGRTGR